uniref:NADH-ubiquinone oxidoreductase chain 3 n=1 Tax=Toxarium undulatum TaxID=210620 RepID=A0A2U9GIN3_9STRA|nr:NADH dehydrogenase subunit 3 [Toxarium undulatum]AWQ64133.1 NADH dehydrogenase subunit 3 [Toxarium undulatum]
MTVLNIQDSLIHEHYGIILIYLITAFILAVVIIQSSYYLAVQNPETQKLSTYECGFEPFEDARNVFDVRFSLVAILFIIFDIETMFLLPWVISLAKLPPLAFWSMIDFIIELGIGLLYIWAVGALNWD